MNRNSVAHTQGDYRRHGMLMILSTLLLSVPLSAAPQHLLTIGGSTSYMGSSSPAFDQPLIFTLFYGGPQGPFPIPAWPVRYGELAAIVPESQGTVLLFNAANTPTFTEFAGLATNGTADDTLVNAVEVGGGGVYAAGTEREYRWRTGSSYQLDEVKLVINCLTVSPDYTSFQTDYHWELWGHEVPEPGACTAAIVLFSTALTRRRKH